MKVAVIGHRKIEKSKELTDKLTELITDLIVNEGADTFLFGSRSQFDDLCYDIVTQLRYQYAVNRIYVRAEYRKINYKYESYILAYYEDTYYPESVYSGRMAYVERNQVLVDMCDVLIVYPDPDYKNRTAKSGTLTAVEYANKKRKRVINTFELLKINAK